MGTGAAPTSRGTALAAGRGLFAGLTVVDLVLGVHGPVGPDQKVRATSQELCAGGPATNAAVTFAALGGHATLLTALGRHPVAGVAREDLRSHRVDLVDATADASEAPTVAAIAVDGKSGGRQVVSAYGRRDAQAPAGVANLVAGCGVVLLDGHHPRLAQAVAEAARGEGVPVLLDAGSWKPHLADLWPLVDLAIASSDFAPPDLGDGDVLGWLHGVGVPNAAVTAGAGPVRWSSSKAKQAERVEPPRVEAVDTLGAGDVFHGAAAWAASGLAPTALPSRLSEILEFACAIAAQRVQIAGARAWVEAVASRPAARRP